MGQAACEITNTGRRDPVIDKFSIRGQESPWNSVYVWTTKNLEVQSDLNMTEGPLTGATANIIVENVS